MQIDSAFTARAAHFLGVEYPAKIEKCLRALPANALWRRAGDDSNSIGNLLLHLQGNVRQWIVCGVGGAPDSRHRASEFAAREGGSAIELFLALRATLDEALTVIASLDAVALGKQLTVQGRDVTAFDAVFHVVEHFALHTGQIILLTKQYAPGTIQFYEDAGGLAIPRWNA